MIEIRYNMTFWWCDIFGFWQWCHMMLVELSKAPLHALGQDNKNKVHHDFSSCDTIGFVITWSWWHCQWHHLHSLCQDNWNNVQHYVFGHLMPLAPASCGSNDIVYGTNVQSLGHDDQNKVQHDFLIMQFHWHQHHMVPTVLSRAHYTDTSTSTHTHNWCFDQQPYWCTDFNTLKSKKNLYSLTRLTVELKWPDESWFSQWDTHEGYWHMDRCMDVWQMYGYNYG